MQDADDGDALISRSKVDHVSTDISSAMPRPNVIARGGGQWLFREQCTLGQQQIDVAICLACIPLFARLIPDRFQVTLCCRGKKNPSHAWRAYAA